MMDERGFIAALRALAPHPGARGLADDCAVIAIGDETLVLTHDMMVSGVHFLPDQDPADVAWKLLATNLSDLAAKGAAPIGVLLGYMLGEDDARFIAGLAEALSHHDVPLLGGDTVGADGVGAQALGLTAIGRATYVPVPSRSGAQVGDGLYVTGPVGAAMVGFETLRDGIDAAADTLAYRRPRALLAQGQALAPVVSAMMDVSDGLLLDASRMARASGVSFAIDTRQVPIATPEARRDEALRWGDDYQLLFTAPPGSSLPVAATCIGHAVGTTGSALILDGIAMHDDAGLGYEHRANQRA